MRNIFFKNIIIILILIFGLKNITFAQTNSEELIISWKVNNFTPYEFVGKKLASPGSNISVSFDFIKNNKIVDLSKSKIYWYVNDELVSNSRGIKQINFIAPNQIGVPVDVRVELPDYAVLKTIEIPIVKPKIVIDVPFPKKEIYQNNFEVNLLPYFFNLTANLTEEGPAAFLNVNWQINGNPAKPANEDPFKLKISVNSNQKTDINIKAFVQNVLNQLEATDKEVNITFVK
jgi:hypothetical protein